MRLARLSLLFAIGVAAACSGARFDNSQGPGVVGPVHLAEGSRQKPELVPNDPDASPPLLNEPKGSQPDPEALRQERQFEYEIVYDRGKIRIAGVRAVRYARPVVTARQMGRYAIELWIGHELVERVRFDFPLVAAEEPRRTKRRPLAEAPQFAPGVVATIKVLVPASTRATRAVLVDRATSSADELPWPPDAPLEAPPGVFRPPADAGASDAGAGSDAGVSQS